MSIIIVLVVIAVLGGGFFYFSKKKAPKVTSVPVSINVPPTSTYVPPTLPPVVSAPPVVPAPVDHVPPANAGSAGSLIGQPVPGGDVPDVNGAVALPAIASKFKPGARFLTVVSLPYVKPGSAAAYSIAVNCQNMALLQGAFAPQPRLDNYMPLVPVANPASAAAVGLAAYHMAGNAAGEAKQYIPNCIAIPNNLDTMDKIVAFCANVPLYGTGYVGAPVAGGQVGMGGQRRINP